MKPKKFNGYWTKKDGSEYIFVEKTFKAGYVTGIRYFKRDGKEIISMIPVKETFEDLLSGYTKGMQ